MVKKFRVSLALQPVAVALFANSPFVEGRPSGFLSYRSYIWTDTDPDRCGTLPFVFEPGFGFERYVDYMLDVPMYFVYRDGRYIDASGQSFRDFMAGKLPALTERGPAHRRLGRPSDDRLPRSAAEDVSRNARRRRRPWRRLCALPALWVGILYDSAALDAAYDLVEDWTDGGARGDAPRCAAARARDTAALPHLARHRARSPGDLSRRAASPGAPQHRRRGRDAFSRPALRDRRLRPHPGGRTARGLPTPAGAARSIRCSPITPIERRVSPAPAPGAGRGGLDHLRAVAEPHRAPALRVVHRCRWRAAGQRHPAFAMP